MDLENEKLNELQSYHRQASGLLCRQTARNLRYGTDSMPTFTITAQGLFLPQWYGLYSKLNYANGLATMAKEKGLPTNGANDGFYYEDKDDVEFDKKMLSSLTESKVGGVITLHLPQYP